MVCILITDSDQLWIECVSTAKQFDRNFRPTHNPAHSIAAASHSLFIAQNKGNGVTAVPFHLSQHKTMLQPLAHSNYKWRVECRRYFRITHFIVWVNVHKIRPKLRADHCCNATGLTVDKIGVHSLNQTASGSPSLTQSAQIIITTLRRFDGHPSPSASHNQIHTNNFGFFSFSCRSSI